MPRQQVPPQLAGVQRLGMNKARPGQNVYVRCNKMYLAARIKVIVGDGIEACLIGKKSEYSQFYPFADVLLELPGSSFPVNIGAKVLAPWIDPKYNPTGIGMYPGVVEKINSATEILVGWSDGFPSTAASLAVCFLVFRSDKEPKPQKGHEDEDVLPRKQQRQQQQQAAPSNLLQQPQPQLLQQAQPQLLQQPQQQLLQQAQPQLLQQPQQQLLQQPQQQLLQQPQPQLLVGTGYQSMQQWFQQLQQHNPQMVLPPFQQQPFQQQQVQQPLQQQQAPPMEAAESRLQLSKIKTVKRVDRTDEGCLQKGMGVWFVLDFMGRIVVLEGKVHDTTKGSLASIRVSSLDAVFENVCFHDIFLAAEAHTLTLNANVFSYRDEEDNALYIGTVHSVRSDGKVEVAWGNGMPHTVARIKDCIMIRSDNESHVGMKRTRDATQSHP